MAKKFECNVGEHDRRGRFILGSLMVFLAGVYGSLLLLILAFVPIFSAIYSFCPVYKLLGFSTINKDNSKK
jgi:hypothetical protein